jgi:hypothetical protein
MELISLGLSSLFFTSRPAGADGAAARGAPEFMSTLAANVSDDARPPEADFVASRAATGIDVSLACSFAQPEMARIRPPIVAGIDRR